ncbi:MAG: hypothetical protein RIR88_699 [Actinomycetota bacterium]
MPDNFEKPIELVDLTKHYGSSRGIEDVTFTVERGEVLGFLGPNGAGKTTAMRVLMGLISKTSGDARVLGYDATKRNPQMLSRIGYLPGTFSAYKNLTATEYLNFFAKMRGVDCHRQIHHLAERLDLNLHRHIHDLSKGNRQKVGLVQAFMHTPDVLILDEPTSGLDPLVQHEFELMLNEAKGRGAAVLLSSHVLSDVEYLANRVAIINEGRLVLVEEINNLKKRAVRRIEMTFPGDVDAQHFASIPGVTEAHTIGHRVICSVEGLETEVIGKAAELGAEMMTTHETSLDEIFFSAISEEQR